MGDGWEAVLNDKFEWESENRKIALKLNIDFSADDYVTAGSGTPGLMQLNKAAKALGAEVRDEREAAAAPEIDGVVY